MEPSVYFSVLVNVAVINPEITAFEFNFRQNQLAYLLNYTHFGISGVNVGNGTVNFSEMPQG